MDKTLKNAEIYNAEIISKTKNWRGLIDELRGYKSGICMGIGSSQHLFSNLHTWPWIFSTGNARQIDLSLIHI